jgi:hypothetical protein
MEDKIDEIDRIALAFKTAYRLSGDNFREYEVRKAKHQISKLIREARIDERVNFINRLSEEQLYDLELQVADRLNQLKEEQLGEE